MQKHHPLSTNLLTNSAYSTYDGTAVRSKPNFFSYDCNEHGHTSAVAQLSEMKIAIAQPLKNTGRNACGTGAERGGENSLSVQQ